MQIIVKSHDVNAVAKTKYKFQSAGNDTASIRLMLYDNMKFDLYFKSFLEDSIETAATIFRGKWNFENEKFVIKFDGKQTCSPKCKPIYLFNSSNSDVDIIDENTFSFNKEKKSIYIWRTLCDKFE